MTCHVGDWVRFRYCDKLVIGVVQYIQVLKNGTFVYVTDQGTAFSDGVLERRAQAGKEVAA